MNWDQVFDDEQHMRRCPVCGCRELFSRKDFPQVTGFVIVLLAALLAMVLFRMREVKWGFAVLGTVALLLARPRTENPHHFRAARLSLVLQLLFYAALWAGLSLEDLIWPGIPWRAGWGPFRIDSLAYYTWPISFLTMLLGPLLTVWLLKGLRGSVPLVVVEWLGCALVLAWAFL